MLPFLIIAVGVENIFVLTNAVVMTSLDLPVKERVGLGKLLCEDQFESLVYSLILLGLARVGVPMLATLGWEMGFLLLGSSIDIPALQVRGCHYQIHMKLRYTNAFNRNSVCLELYLL